MVLPILQNDVVKSSPYKLASHKKEVFTRSMKRARDPLTAFKARLHDFGWRKAFLNAHIDETTTELLDDRREAEVLELFTNDWLDKALQSGSSATDEDIIYATGLRRAAARHLFRTIAPLYGTCYTRRQLLEIAIECALGRYKPMNVPGPYLFDAPLKQWTVNTLFKNVFNATSLETIDEHVLPPPFSTFLSSPASAATIFFHATSWACADNIMKRGIAHLTGRKCLDFGMQPSFYLTPSLADAKEWCAKKRRVWCDQACILVFHVPSNPTLKHKRFATANEEWVDLVTESRLCEANFNELDNCDLVYGPMAANPEAIEKGEARARPHRRARFQLASKSNSSDTYLRHCYTGCIFARAGSKTA